MVICIERCINSKIIKPFLPRFKSESRSQWPKAPFFFIVFFVFLAFLFEVSVEAVLVVLEELQIPHLYFTTYRGYREMFFMLDMLFVTMCRARWSPCLNGKICPHTWILHCEHRLCLMGKRGWKVCLELPLVIPPWLYCSVMASLEIHLWLPDCILFFKHSGSSYSIAFLFHELTLWKCQNEPNSASSPIL